ncbi:hypothetical protein [Roseibium sp.]|uniref:hypothetical protein n=1 Tax=Roseibium sp. TaxID=1936156 RepID=UPI0032985B0F
MTRGNVTPGKRVDDRHAGPGRTIRIDNGRIDIERGTVFCLIAFYPLARFISEPLSLVVLLALAAALVTLMSSSRAIMRRLPLLLFVVLLFGLPSAGAYVVGETVAAKYLLFCSLIVIVSFVAAFKNVVPSPKITLYVSLFSGLAAMAFLAYPEIGNYSAFREVEIGGIEGTYDETRFRGYFVHGNDLGIFASGLLCLIIMMGSRQVGLKAGWAVGGAVVSAAVIISESATAAIIVAVVVLWRFLNERVLTVLLAAVVSAVAVSQLWYSAAAAEVLESGSFWWRYDLADRVVRQSDLATLSPAALASEDSWSHSLIVDIVMIFGFFPSVVLFCLVLSTIVWVRPSYTIAVYTLLLTASVQPAGAMPASFMMLALALFSFARWKASATAMSISRLAGRANNRRAA